MVAFFSTTMFPLMTLGRYWCARHALPYVLDFQDPWVREAQGAGSKEQGAKRKAADFIARRLEPFAMGRVSHIVSVSPTYVSMLHARYSRLTKNDFTVLPFGAPEADYSQLRAQPVRQTVFDPKDGKRHWVYVGRGGGDMAFALKAIFQGLRRMVDIRPNLRSELRLHFIGTDYAPRERAKKTIEPLANEAGLSDIVSEQTDRVPYFEALQCLLDADATIIPGSDDPGYTASKLYPYILARKPLLAVFHHNSSVVGILQKTKGGTVVSFGSNDTVESVAEKILATRWLDTVPVPETNWIEFEPYTAREMTRRLCAVFDQVTEAQKHSTEIPN